jgi:hypothetical protein
MPLNGGVSHGEPLLATDDSPPQEFEVMMRLIYPAAFGLALFGAETISTDYTHGETLRIEVTSTFSMETETSMERDGEPVDSRFGGGRNSSETRTVVMFDEVLEEKDGRPSRLSREFESIEGVSVSSRGDEERESERECPLSEVTLELTLKDGEVLAEVIDGSEPDDDALLEGHLMPLSLDALFPEDDVESGDSWDIEGDALIRALGLDIESALFPRPQRPEAGERGEGGGGRGDRRGRGSRGGGGVKGYFTNGEVDGEATLEADTEEWGGVECLVISIEAECTGEMPEREFGGGGGRGGGGGGVAVSPSSAIPENSFEIELEGKLLFSVADKRPVYFEIEGTVGTESLREMERGGSSMSFASIGDGTFKHTVEITVAGTDDE